MQKKMNRRLAGALGACAALALALGIAACGGAPAAPGSAGSAAESSAKTVVFTDSAGREVEVPSSIERAVPSGHTANQVMITLAPEKLVGLSQELADDQAAILGDRVPADLPVLGAAFGSKGDLNKEALAATGAQVVIDTGEYKEGMAEDLDALQEQLGVPVVFIETKLDEWGSAYRMLGGLLVIDTGEYKEGMAEDLDALQEQLGVPVVFIETKLDEWGSAYRMLGGLLGVEERAEELAGYCDRAYDEVSGMLEDVPADERVRVLYCLGPSGTNVIAKGSFQANVVDMLADNVAVVDAPSGKGNGNESSLEQIAAWNPDVILFGPDSPYDAVGTDEVWQTIPAVAAGRIHKVPTSPYCWLNYPPSVNQVLGMQWLARVLYPGRFDEGDGAYDVARDYYKTFYGCDLTKAEYDGLVG